MADSDSFGIMDWLRLLSTVIWLVIFVFWPQITLALTLMGIGAIFIAFNGLIFWLTVIRKEHTPAVAPIFGGIIAATGILLLPMNSTWQWAWIPLVIDWGGLPIFFAWCIERFRS